MTSCVRAMPRPGSCWVCFRGVLCVVTSLGRGGPGPLRPGVLLPRGCGRVPVVRVLLAWPFAPGDGRAGRWRRPADRHGRRPRRGERLLVLSCLGSACVVVVLGGWVFFVCC